MHTTAEAAEERVASRRPPNRPRRTRQPPSASPPPGWAAAAYAPQTQPAAAPPGWYTTPAGTTAWWDGFQWLQGPPTRPIEPYQSIDRISTAAIALLALSGIVSLLEVFGEMNRFQLMGQVIDRPGSVSHDTVQAADGIIGVLSIIDVVLLLTTGIVFLVWLNQVFKNLRGPLQAGRLEYTPGWAVGWWFVPFANFVKPKQVMNEAWKASDPGSPDPSVPPTHGNHRKPPALLSWWWAAWISAGLISRLSVSFGNDGAQFASASSLRTQFMWSGIGAALYVVAAVLAVLVVRAVSQRHHQRARNLAARAGWGV